MIPTLKTGKRVTLAAIAALVLFASCVKEDTPEAGGETLVEVTIKAPGAPATRALDQTGENEVKYIDILAFDPVTGRFEYGAQCNTVTTPNSSTPGLKTFSVTLREGTWDLVILANMRDEVSVSSLLGTNKAAALAALAVSMPSGGWPADGSAPLPMWGEVTARPIVQGTTIGSGGNPLPMTRMHAAVDIELSAAAAAAFELESVRLYNYYAAGLAVPATGDPLKWDTSAWEAVSPSLPPSPGTTKGPVFYDNSAPAADKTQYKGEIYLFEAVNGGLSAHPDVVCLVVGGTYLPTGDPAFYRVDFSTVDAGRNRTYLDILRNHKYTVSVDAVTGPGFPDEDKAYNSVDADIEVTVTDWHLGGEIVMDPDGQRYLWLSDLGFEADEAGQAFTMTIDTDATSWTARVSESDTDPTAGGASWLSVTPSSGGAGTHSLTVTADHTDNPFTRMAYLHIDADNRLDAVVKVEQEGWYIIDVVTINPIGDIPPAGETRTITVQGLFENIDVRAWDMRADELIVAATVPSNKISGNISSSTTLVIPKLWLNGTRQISFEYYSVRDGQWIPITVEDQEGYDFTVTTTHVQGETIQYEGGSYTVTVSGLNWPNVHVRAIVQGTTYTVIAPQIKVPAGKGMDNSQTLTVEANNSWVSRIVQFHWCMDGTPWENYLTFGTQAGYNITGASVNPTTIAGGGQGITVTVSGAYPANYVQVRAVDVTNSNTQLVAGNITSGTSAILAIPNNGTGKVRNVTFEYRRYVNSVWESNWTTITTISQPEGNKTVPSTGRVIAVANIYPSSWAEAMGIPLIYNTTTYPDALAKYTTDYAVGNGGCADYWEGSINNPVSGQGIWRLPTLRESDEMFNSLTYDYVPKYPPFTGHNYGYTMTVSSTNGGDEFYRAYGKYTPAGTLQDLNGFKDFRQNHSGGGPITMWFYYGIRCVREP